MNRLTPLRIWGPSGATPEYGTKHAMDLMEQMYVWDIGTRGGVIDFRGGQLDVTEFAFDGVNEVIYEEKGVTIRSIPAVHGLDGAVSFILEWNGLKFAYSSDTIPNKWWAEHTKGADISIHECFLPSVLLVTKQGFAPLEALNVGTQGHTSPEQFGKVMSADEAPPRGRLPFLQRLRHAAGGDAPGAQDLRRTSRAGAGLHGLQRQQGRDSRADVRESTKRSGRVRR